MARGSEVRLEQPPCKRPDCPLFGQPHPRCRAHAKKNGPGPCMAYPMSAQLVCRMHGGMQQSSRDKAQRLIAEDKIKSRVSCIVAYNELDRVTPEEGLLMEVKWSGQVAIALGEACAALIADEALTTKSAGAGVQINALLDAWTKERISHARLCALALQAGIQQRQLDLVESQANQVVSAILAVLMSPRLALTAEQVIEGRIVAAEILRSLPPAPQALPMPMPQ
jgi:hypothetical protein